jgi:hypothetical protein
MGVELHFYIYSAYRFSSAISCCYEKNCSTVINHLFNVRLFVTKLVTIIYDLETRMEIRVVLGIFYIVLRFSYGKRLVSVKNVI